MLAITEGPGRLDQHHGFPFVLAFAWPVVYEVLKTRWLTVDQQQNPLRPIRVIAEGKVIATDRGLALDDGRRTVIVVATIAICVATIVAAPHALWVIGHMSPESRHKRQATLVLMDFLDQGWADKLSLKADEGVSAVSPDKIGELTPGGGIRLEPGGRGVIFYATELYAPRALGYPGFYSQVQQSFT
jgi:hypothetical protein